MKVIQIEIEQGQAFDGTPNTYLWALTDDGQIFVRIRGEWTKEDGPQERPKRKRKPTGIE
jgi:hypothetical protein